MTPRMSHQPGVPETVCPYSGVVAPDNDFRTCLAWMMSRALPNEFTRSAANRTEKGRRSDQVSDPREVLAGRR